MITGTAAEIKEKRRREERVRKGEVVRLKQMKKRGRIQNES